MGAARLLRTSDFQQYDEAWETERKQMEPKRVQYIETPPRKNTLAKPAKTAAATVGRPTGSCESVWGGGIERIATENEIQVSDMGNENK